MTIQYTLTLEDYIDFNLYHLGNAPSAKRNYNIQRFIVPVLYMLLPFTLLKGSQFPTYAWVAIFAAVSGLWVAYYPTRYKKLIIKRITKMVNESKNAHFTSLNALHLKEDAFTVVNENSETQVKIAELEKVIDTEKYFYLYLGAMSAFIIPKRSFESKAQENEFKSAVTKK